MLTEPSSPRKLLQRPATAWTKITNSPTLEHGAWVVANKPPWKNRASLLRHIPHPCWLSEVTQHKAKHQGVNLPAGKTEKSCETAGDISGPSPCKQSSETISLCSLQILPVLPINLQVQPGDQQAHLTLFKQFPSLPRGAPIRFRGRCPHPSPRWAPGRCGFNYPQWKAAGGKRSNVSEH